MTTTQWKTLFGATSAVCAFVLAQPDVAVPPVVKLILGCIIVALSVINPDRGSE